MKQRKFWQGAISALLLSFGLVQSAFGFGNTEQQDSIAAFAKQAPASETISFSAQDFTSRLSSGAKLDGILLQSLPDPKIGTLTQNGHPLTEGEGVSAAGLEQLEFTPAVPQAVVTFSFIPVFSTSIDTGSETTVTLAVGQEPNTPPTVSDITTETYENVYIEIPLEAGDPEGDAVTYQILDAPKFGTAVIVQDRIQYTPNTGKRGLDTFTYVATDEKGNTSTPAKISIQIRKNSAKLTYADMKTNDAHLAALKLSQMGIVTGQKIGTNYFFQPDDYVSRNEFVTMVAQAAHLKPTDVITTFADDASIAVWAKPYVSAAEKAGLISGYATATGDRVMCGDQTITLAEACVMIQNLLQLNAVTSTASFTDAPVWAQSAANILWTHKILSDDFRQASSTMTGLTKAEAAKLLYAVLNYN